jgi:hypothetical protein
MVTPTSFSFEFAAGVLGDVAVDAAGAPNGIRLQWRGRPAISRHNALVVAANVLEAVGNPSTATPHRSPVAVDADVVATACGIHLHMRSLSACKPGN